MTNMDDLLEESLQSIEKGQSPEQVTATLPPEAQELGELIQLAAQVRTIPHPGLASFKRRLAAGTARHTGRQWTLLPGTLRLPQLNHFATAGLMAAVMLLVIFGAWLGGPVGADAAVLADVSGQVEVREAGQNTWHTAEVGEQIRRGQAVRTGSGSSATLAFFEGSRTMLAAGTQLGIKQLDGSWGSSLRLELDQKTGRTVHAVIPLRGDRSFFRVQTPTGQARVHGTTFEVAVRPAGKSRFAVSSGGVEVDYKGEQVFITSGQTTVASQQSDLSDPSYLFTISGTITSAGENMWQVEGLTFSLADGVTLPADLQPDSVVWVSGRILPDGQHLADSITTTPPADAVTVLTGVIDLVTDYNVAIGEVIFRVNPEMVQGLEVGDEVRVTFQVVDGGIWEALTIEPLQTDVQTEVTVTPAHPDLQIKPEEYEVSSCNTSFTLPVELFNQASGEVNAATNLQLGYMIEDGSSAISSVNLTPQSWAQIAAGQKVDFSLQLQLVPDWFEQVKKVKLRVYIASEDHRDAYGTKLTFNLTSCQEVDETPDPTVTGTPATPTATDTATVTPSPTVTGTPATPTPTPDPEDDDEDICTGADPHPMGMRLAEEHQVTYEEIMGWFCERPANGFGEIDLAYNLAEQYELPVEEIFAMRDQKQGWGQIKKSLEEQATAEPGQEVTPDQKKTKQNKPDKTKLPPGLAKTPKPGK